uniref:C2H2-type domain-containing protein n=1 Tax=Meloidogyne hapla TaxID=6305 RepID=A0A1I8BES0_MELHA
AFCDEEDLRKTAKAAELQLDDSAAFVNVSEGARKAIALIPDVIGDSRCALCKIKFEDVFRLAMHKCPRIQHEEYKCKECEKVIKYIFCSVIKCDF